MRVDRRLPVVLLQSCLIDEGEVARGAGGVRVETVLDELRTVWELLRAERAPVVNGRVGVVGGEGVPSCREESVALGAVIVPVGGGRSEVASESVLAPKFSLAGSTVCHRRVWRGEKRSRKRRGLVKRGRKEVGRARWGWERERGRKGQLNVELARCFV